MIWNVAFIVLMTVMPADSGDAAERDEAVRLARTLLKEHLHVDDAALQVEDATSVDWPDAGLGCPQKGMAYIQVITPGYRVRLRAADKTYEVHVGAGRAVMCPEGPAGRQAGGGASRPAQDSYLAAVARLSAEARGDLARRLKVPEQSIDVKFARPTTWPDADLGCGSTGAKPRPAETKGFLIELGHAGKTYRYHTDMNRVRFCA
jgi:hypothetical protein